MEIHNSTFPYGNVFCVFICGIDSGSTMYSGHYHRWVAVRKILGLFWVEETMAPKRLDGSSRLLKKALSISVLA